MLEKRFAGSGWPRLEAAEAAEAKQQRDASGRFAATEPDDTGSGGGLDQGARGGPPAEDPPPNEQINASLRERFFDGKGF